MEFNTKFDKTKHFNSNVTNKDQFIRSNVSSGGGGIGTRDYEKLKNLPSVNGVELIGNQSFEDLGRMQLTNSDIREIVDKAMEEIFK